MSAVKEEFKESNKQLKELFNKIYINANIYVIIKEYKRINCFKFFINALIEVARDINNKNNYNSTNLNKSGINKLINKEQLGYFS